VARAVKIFVNLGDALSDALPIYVLKGTRQVVAFSDQSRQFGARLLVVHVNGLKSLVNLDEPVECPDYPICCSTRHL